jgi:transposase-like protein
MTQRAVPFYCPYCGDEDLQPYEDRHGAWWCQSCRRAWTLSMIGTGTPNSVRVTDDAVVDDPGGEATT